MPLKYIFNYLVNFCVLNGTFAVNEFVAVRSVSGNRSLLAIEPTHHAILPNNYLDTVTDSVYGLRDIPEAASCRGKCGSAQEMPCTCDRRCVVYKNCCDDFPQICESVLLEGVEKFGHLLDLDIQCFLNNLVISSCVSGADHENEKLSHEKSFRALSIVDTDLRNHVYHPVTDVTTGLVYKNREIFQCHANNQSVPVRWDLVLDGAHLSEENRFTLATINEVLKTSNLFVEGKSSNGSSKGLLCDNDFKFSSKLHNSIDLHRNGAHHFSVLTYVTCDNNYGIQKIFTRYEAAEYYGQQASFRCRHYLETFPFKIIPDQARVTYFDNLMEVTFIPASHQAPVSWVTILCDLNAARGSNRSRCCNVTCNAKLGFVKRGYSCVRLHVYYIALPSSFPLTELDNMASTPHFVHCMLKNELMLDALDEWLPVRNLFVPVLNTSFYTMAFLMYSDNKLIQTEIKFVSLMRWLTFLLTDFNLRSVEFQRCPKIESSTQRLKVNDSADVIDLKIADLLFRVLDNAVCFDKLYVSDMYDRDGHYEFNKTPTYSPARIGSYFSMITKLNTSGVF